MALTYFKKYVLHPNEVFHIEHSTHIKILSEWQDDYGIMHYEVEIEAKELPGEYKPKGMDGRVFELPEGYVLLYYHGDLTEPNVLCIPEDKNNGTPLSVEEYLKHKKEYVDIF